MGASIRLAHRALPSAASKARSQPPAPSMGSKRTLPPKVLWPPGGWRMKVAHQSTELT
jgi:hypothetical protein